MLKFKDYSHLTLKELVSEEKIMKSRKVIMAVLIGVLVGIAIYSATNRGFILPVVLLIAAFTIGSHHANNLKNIRAEIRRKSG